uniref:Ribosome biogenesis regulatory protein n=1 Tax=Plectus sambesii TaxID=2011161 RepID=A0A914WVB3_9BILA
MTSSDPTTSVVFKSTEVNKSVEPRIDLGHLLIEDLDPTEIKECPSNEELLETTRDNVQYLFNQIWQLETVRIEDAICVKLPTTTTRLPREKPVPSVRGRTKWEQYAQDKGIRKHKKDKLVWDEQTKAWKPRFGYRRGNDNTKDWMIEIPDQKDPYADHFAERKEQKKERVGKNEFQRLRNLAKNSGGPDRRSRSQPTGANNIPLGVGIDAQQRTPQELGHQISRAKMATASMGKFQQNLSKEKPPKDRAKKRQFAPNEQGGTVEKQRHLDILSKMGAKKPKFNAERAFASQQGQQPSEGGASDTSDKKKRTDRPRQKNAIHRQQHFLTKSKETRKGRGRGGASAGGRDGPSARGRGGSSARGGSRGGRGGRGRGRGGGRGGGRGS